MGISWDRIFLPLLLLALGAAGGPPARAAGEEAPEARTTAATAPEGVTAAAPGGLSAEDREIISRLELLENLELCSDLELFEDYFLVSKEGEEE